MTPSRRVLAALALFAFTILLWYWGKPKDDTLVVYCAHDSVFAEGILQDFERETGIKVAARYDTEATKSLGLVELLVREKDRPRCDVFWNNEMLGTMDLAEQGVLAVYHGPGWDRIPVPYKDPDGRWAGFAARFRVHIVNTKALGIDDPRLAAMERSTVTGDLTRVAIAKPLYGTTLTHYVALWNIWGADGLKAWHSQMRKLGLRELNGNGAVKDAVARGACDYGFTDTDDFFAAKDAGYPVAMRPVRLESGQTICIPNTVSVVNGTRRQLAAQRLTDYLLSPSTELALARSKSRQIPLGPIADDQLPDEVRAMRPWVAEGIPLAPLAKSRTECLNWLRSQ